MSLSIDHTHTHSLVRMSEREVARIRERDYYCREIIFIFFGFTFGADSISEEVVGFLLYGFPEENYLCLLYLVLCLCFIDVHVILLVKDPKIIMVA